MQRTNYNIGEQNGSAKLKRKDVRYIRTKKAKDLGATKLAEKFKVCRYTIYKIWNGKSWASVT